ncbi:MAG: hypothetical protein Q7K26_02150 [bacterium]|nr:hypothetical protein [bacterium]
MSKIDRYELANACEKIDGYYNPSPSESALKKYEQTFDRAKAECVMHLEKQLADVKSIEFSNFGIATKRSKLFAA